MRTEKSTVLHDYISLRGTTVQEKKGNHYTQREIGGTEGD
jgi:hypothetical protein